MSVPTVTIHGAGNTVTGSCFEIGWGKRCLLVDCGMFQGSRSLEALNREPFGFAPSKLDAVLLTHAHLDHVQSGFGSEPRIIAVALASVNIFGGFYRVARYRVK